MAKSDVLVRMKADTQNYDANIAKACRQLDQFKKDNLSMGGVLKQLSGSLVGAAAGFASITAAVGAATAAISSNIETAKNFEKSMSQLSSLTGKVGEDLNKLKEYAIDLGGSTTLTASQVADAFKMIGSQQPQLLSSSEALKAVTKNAITLAEAAGIDLATAAQTLSTSINQMGGDSANAERYINVLAAASQKGAGDISWLGEAITKSATAAKAVGTDYEELVANLEQLAKAGFDASTAGTALRSIIMNLEKQANQDFKPSIVGLTQAFENLGKANLTITQYQEIAGKMFASQAMALANAADEAKRMREEITGTNTAEGQAETNTDNLAGSLKSLSSAWEALNLHINSSNGLLKSAVDWLKDVVKWADQAFTAAGRAQKKLAELQGGGNGKQTTVDKQLSTLRGSQYKNANFNAQVSRYNRQIAGIESQLSKARYNLKNTPGTSQAYLGIINDLEAELSAVKSMRDEYKSRAKQILNPGSGGGSNSNQTITIDADTEPATKSIKELQAEIKKLKKLRDDAADEGNFEMRDKYNADIKSIQAQIKTMRGGGSDTTKKELTELQQNQQKINDLTQEYVKLGDESTEAARKRQEEIQKEIKLLEQRNGLLGLRAEQAQGRLLPQTIDLNTNGVAKGSGLFGKETQSALSKPAQLSDKAMKAVEKNIQKQTDLQVKELKEKDKEDKSLATGLGKLSGGFGQLDQGLSALGIDLGDGFGSVVSGLQGISSILMAIQTIVSAIQAISAIDAIIPFAGGGIIGKAAGGMLIPGNSFSGDNLRMPVDGGRGWIGVNSGELILNHVQQNNLANALTGGGMQNLNLSASISGEQIRLVLNNNGRRTGRGEYIQTNFR